MERWGRFAPSLSGQAHEGTYLNALLCWLQARSVGAKLLVRWDDLDTARVRRAHQQSLSAGLAALGLSADAVVQQSDRVTLYEAALDRLAAMGRLYPCACSRARLRGLPNPLDDGSPRYDNHCRPATPQRHFSWREKPVVWRVRLCGTAQSPDVVVRRKDGVLSFLLTSTVDDGLCGVTDAVRGRDLAPMAASQHALARLLGHRVPSFHHHLLLRRTDGKKLSKSAADGAQPPRLGADHIPAMLGWLAWTAGLQAHPMPTTLDALLASFRWARLRRSDRVLSEAQRWPRSAGSPSSVALATGLNGQLL